MLALVLANLALSILLARSDFYDTDCGGTIDYDSGNASTTNSTPMGQDYPSSMLDIIDNSNSSVGLLRAILFMQTRMQSCKTAKVNLSETKENKSLGIPDEYRLRSDLFDEYLKEARPVRKRTDVTNVTISLSKIQLVDLDEQNQVMFTKARITLKWYDCHLKWDPAAYNFIDRIYLDPEHVWNPDIILFNNAENLMSVTRYNYLVELHSNGSLIWNFEDLLKSYCVVSIRYFPFDRQVCNLEFQSWSQGQREVSIDFETDRIHKPSYIYTEWKLYNMSSGVQDDNGFNYVEYKLHLKRNHAYYVNHFIFPFMLISSLSKKTPVRFD